MLITVDTCPDSVLIGSIYWFHWYFANNTLLNRCELPPFILTAHDSMALLFSFLPQLCHPAYHFPLSWRKQPCGQKSDTFCATSWSHNQHGWHSSVWGSGSHFYCPGQWHGPELWPDPDHQVSFSKHKYRYWRSVYLFSFILQNSFTLPVFSLTPVGQFP